MLRKLLKAKKCLFRVNPDDNEIELVAVYTFIKNAEFQRSSFRVTTVITLGKCMGLSNSRMVKQVRMLYITNMSITFTLTIKR